MNKTPLQRAITAFKNIGDTTVGRGEILIMLESLLPKEKEFAGKCYDAGYERKQEEADNDWKDGPKPVSPDKQQFIDNLYKSH